MYSLLTSLSLLLWSGAISRKKTMLIHPSTVTTTRLIVIQASFPNLSISGGGSSGISWFDTGNHQRQFPFDFANQNFEYHIGRIKCSDTFSVTANIPGDPPQSILLQLWGVDSGGSDIGSDPIASWIFTDGQRGNFVFVGAIDAAIGPPASPAILASGIRLQYVVSDCTFGVTLPDPLIVIITAGGAVSF